MCNNFVSWTNLRNLFNSKKVPLQYIETPCKYVVYFIDGVDRYWTEIWKDTSKVKGINIEQNDLDKQDFENNYKPYANKPIEPKSDDGKTIVRAESRPLGTTTVFTGQADSDNNIGDGKILAWDFSNNNDLVDAPNGYKRKRIEFKFIDSVWIKEGTIYYHNVLKNSYVDFYVVCPAGQYYYDNNNNLKQATSDTIISHYVIHHPIQDNVPMGDELNTESCSSEIPSTYKFWIDVTVPDSDNQSNGHIELEIFRKRTVIL